MVNKESLSVLIVDYSKQSQKELTKLIESALPKYILRQYYADSCISLLEMLNKGHYDLAIVDFDLNESSGWKYDATYSSRKISEMSPKCIRVGISFVGEHAQEYEENELYHIVLDKMDPRRKEKLASKLKEMGF